MPWRTASTGGGDLGGESRKRGPTGQVGQIYNVSQIRGLRTESQEQQEQNVRVEFFKIEHESEADEYLKDLLANPQYRSMNEVQLRAEKYIEDTAA